ncbi:DNA repair and recombination protein RAD26 [Phyllosticta citriasiana]|uniref:DNA repair and recombination protein RAD26 n=1 Tax=Phyllosticta citriasiana TaxID=595635 RepID=A0ABR1KLS8_9PEZI
MLNNKPFKSPLLSRKPSTNPSEPSRPSEPTGPPSKKRRVSEDSNSPVYAQPRSSQTSGTFRKPLLSIVNPAANEPTTTSNDDGNEAYYMVLWRKFTTKKNKTWDGDGVLSVRNGYAYLQDIDGREMGKTNCSIPLLPGSTVSVGGKEVEVDSIIAKKDYLAGKPFLNHTPAPVIRAPESKEKESEKKPLLSSKARNKQEKVEAKQVEVVNVAAAKSSHATNGKFKNPLLDKSAMPIMSNTAVPQPRHDPKGPDALVMKRPSSVPKGKQVVDVVVDPILSKHLRDHQREGVSFLYECVMGMGPYNGQGAILADEMGLGKTLQSIALIWTLMKQNPVHEEPPVVKKTLVVAPAGTVQNWRKEFRKWLGRERIGVFVADDPKIRLRDFTRGRCYQVMIIGFEKLQKSYDEISKDCQIDLIVIDESHRLKTAKNKSSAAIRALNCDRIVSLSGTPFSNNLLEFHAVADLVNPGCLGKLSTFKREFENPIVKASQPEATAKDKEKGTARQQELDRLVEAFMLRRRADVLSRYLPPKTEHILLCQPTNVQAEIYRQILASPVFKGALGSGGENAFQLINILKQVCNIPMLLSNPKSITSPNDTPEPESKTSLIKAALDAVPAKLLKNPGISAKWYVLDSLLHQIHSTTEEKVVVVSHFTTTLDRIGNLLTSLSYPYLRIDGSVAANKRQDMINKFNNSSASSTFAFLLSTKAGGVGINLVGASRLILYDIDWNPAHELQAMARIHRDGQKRPCKIYRLLTMGALDEKIYQRQLSKQSLADSVIDNKSAGSSFTKDDLRDLFTLDESGRCQTHELIACPCEGRGNDGGLVPSNDTKEPVLQSNGVDDTDDEGDFPDLPALLKASQVDMAAQEKDIKGKKKFKGGDMMALMQYAHIDTSLLKRAAPKRAIVRLGDDEDSDEDAAEAVAEDAVDLEAMIDDEPLLQVLKEQDSRVKFVFSKTTS